MNEAKTTWKPSDMGAVSGLAGDLERLKKTSGLSYRQIANAASGLKANDGYVELPPSTVVDILRARRLPTDKQLRTFLHVCEVRHSEAAKLLAARQRLAEKKAIALSAPEMSAPSSGIGRPITPELDPFALEVHEAIKVPGNDSLPQLPPYLAREHDEELTERVRMAVGGRSTMAVLVGGSSTGKTRACWEAIRSVTDGQQLLEGWRLWHPFSPTRADAALDALEQVRPRTVIWLNETQFYLLTEGSDHGERIAARLRAVLNDPARAPVIVLGTIWPDYWDTLTRRPHSEQPDLHAQARELLAGTHIPVAESFDQTVLETLRKSPGQDPRLVEAATRAEAGELTQYLAGAPALLQRYETAPLAAKALLTAAMDLRRLGHGPALPRGLLEAATPAYLSDRAWHDLDENWFSAALNYAERPCHGANRPLTRLRPRSGGRASKRLRYRLADYLEQTGRKRRHREIVPSGLWPELITHMEDLRDGTQLGAAAAARLLLCHAIPLLRRAADSGEQDASSQLTNLLAQRADVEGLRVQANTGDGIAAQRLAKLLAERDDTEGLRTRADAGDRLAAQGLAVLLEQRGDVKGLQIRAKAGDSYCAIRLSNLLTERGDTKGAIAILRTRAADGDASAAYHLADLLAKRGDIKSLRVRANAGDMYATSKLASLLTELGDTDGAILALRTLADAGYRDDALRLANLLTARADTDGAIAVLQPLADAGHRDASSRLADLLAKLGDVAALQTRANAGDRRAASTLAYLLAGRGDVEGLRTRADQGDRDAAARLADLLVERGDVDGLRVRALAGDMLSASRLVPLLTMQGNAGDAIALVRPAAEAGDKLAASVLTDLLTKQGDIDGVIAILRIRARSDRLAAMRLSHLLAERGDIEGLQVQADAGSMDAAISLANLLAEEGDVAGLRRRADGGDRHAGSRLARMLAQRGDIEGLRLEILRGNSAGAEILVELLAKQRPRSAERLRRVGLNPDGTIPWEGSEADSTSI